MLLLAGASACGLPSGKGGGDQSADRSQTLRAARTQFAAAAAALRSGDRPGFLEQVPVGQGSSAPALRKDLARIFDTLSPLPWRSFSFAVTAMPGRPDEYRVVGSGQLGAAGPPDRLAVVRYLVLKPAGAGKATITGDATPQDLRRRYLMALHEPVVLQRPGFIVIADRWARGRAHTVLAKAGQARPRLSRLGLDTGPTVLITVYGSVEDVRDALAVKAITQRLVFFSHPPLRVAEKQWTVYDVAVMGPWLDTPGVSLGDVLVHELAHAYSIKWFAGDSKPPALLVEGVAEAAEGPSTTQALRDEVTTGDQLWPLPESFGVTDVWDGADSQGVGLGYDVGASLVDYVVSRWGAKRLERFVTAVAAAKPTKGGMDEALSASLGVDWTRFYNGWRGFVLRGG